MRKLVTLRSSARWGIMKQLQHNNLSGPIPEGILNLTLLKLINLSKTRLSGKLPSEWGPKFTNLKSLIIHTNSLTGKVPHSWKDMKSLQRLQLNDNLLCGPLPSWLSQLEKSDDVVDLGCNYFTGPRPQWPGKQDTWRGNCFESDMQTHEKICDDNLTCANGPHGEICLDDPTYPGTAVVASIVVSVAVLCVILVALYIFWSRTDFYKDRRCLKGKGTEDWVVPLGVRRFTYKEILKATKSFDKSCEIGEGGFGKVYFGDLEDGKCVAIKRAGELRHQGMKEFQNEITLLSRLHHRHLVRLEGFCDDKDERILVYEYMVNGNLHRQLFEKEAELLNWYRRLEIALAVAQGLDYLHSFADPPIIHRDVKPSNILLDDNMSAKVSDFGISKANVDMDTHVSTRPAGTAGYWDPQYFIFCQLTTASDVYGYGVVLLQLITGRHCFDRKRLEDNSLVAWVKKSLAEEGIRAVIDPRLEQNFPVQLYEEVAEIAMNCTAFERNDRPTMTSISSKLEQILSRAAPPPEHFRPVSITYKGETSNLRDEETELSLSNTTVEAR